MRIWWSAFLLILSSQAPASTDVIVLNLKGAVQYALDHSPDAIVARKKEQMSNLEYQNAFAQFLPSLNFTTTQGLQNLLFYGTGNSLLIASPTAPWFSTLSLGLKETLFDSGESIVKYKIANLNRQMASATYLKTRDSVTLDVSTQYYKFSLAKQMIGVRDQQRAIVEKQFRMISSQYLQGIKTKSDFLRLKAELQRSIIEQTNVQNTVAVSRAQLLNKLGASTAEPIQFEPVNVDPTQKISELLPKEAPPFENTYEYQISNIQNEIYDKTVNYAWQKYLPQVTLAGGVSYNNLNFIHSTSPFAENGQYTWEILLTLEYNLWDWGIRRRNVTLAEYKRDVDTNELRKTLLESNNVIASLTADINKIRANYDLTQQLLALEQQSYENMEFQYHEGKNNFLDLITSLNSLLDARIQFFTSYFDALTSLAKHNYFQRKLYETIFNS